MLSLSLFFFNCDFKKCDSNLFSSFRRLPTRRDEVPEATATELHFN